MGMRLGECIVIFSNLIGLISSGAFVHGLKIEVTLNCAYWEKLAIEEWWFYR